MFDFNIQKYLPKLLILSTVLLAACNGGSDTDTHMPGNDGGDTPSGPVAGKLLGLGSYDRSGSFIISENDARTQRLTEKNLSFGLKLFHITYAPGRNVYYSVDYTTGHLVSIDASSYSQTLVGTLGIRTSVLDGIAYDPEQDLIYAIGFNILYTIDPTNAVTTSVGETLFASSLFKDMAYDAQNTTLYAVSNSQLYRINRARGQATIVGDTGYTTISGLGFNSDTNTLYAQTDDGRFLRINQETGVASYLSVLSNVYSPLYTEASQLTYNSTSKQLVAIDENQFLQIDMNHLNPILADTDKMMMNDITYNATDEFLYASVPAEGRIYLLNFSSGEVSPIGVKDALGFSSVSGLAYNVNANVLYGVNESTDQLLTIDTSTGVAEPVNPLTQIGDDLYGISSLAYDPNTDTLYAMDRGSRLFTINSNSGVGTLIGQVDPEITSPLPTYIAFDPNSDRLYSYSRANELLLIDTSNANGTVVADYSLGPRFAPSRLASLAFNSNDDILYGNIFGPLRNVIVEVPTNGNTPYADSLLASTPRQSFANSLAYDPVAKMIYSAGENGLSSLDVTTGYQTQIVPITELSQLRDIAFDPDTDTFYGISRSNPIHLVSVSKLTGEKTDIGHPVTFSGVGSLAFDSKSGTLYGVKYEIGSAIVTTIDTVTGVPTAVEYIAPIENLSFAYGAAIDSNNNVLYIIGVEGIYKDVYLYKVDMENGSLLLREKTGRYALSGLAYLEDTGTLVSYDNDYQIAVKINTVNGKSTAINAQGFNVDGHYRYALTYNSDDGKIYGFGVIYYTSLTYRKLFSINPDTGEGTFVADIPSNVRIYALAYNSNAGIMYSSNGDSISTLDLSTGSFTHLANVSGIIDSMAFDTITDSLYVSQYGGSIMELDPMSGALTPSYSTNMAIRAMAFDQVTGILYVTGPEKKLSRIDLKNSTTKLIGDLQTEILGLAIRTAH